MYKLLRDKGGIRVNLLWFMLTHWWRECLFLISFNFSGVCPFTFYRFIIHIFMLHNEITQHMLSVIYYPVFTLIIPLLCPLYAHYNVHIMFSIISVASHACNVIICYTALNY